MKMTHLSDEVEKNFWEMWSTFGRGPGCALHESEDVIWFENPIPIIPYNGVLKFKVEDDVDGRIDEIVSRFVQRGASFMWVVHPTSAPLDLAERLETRGLREVERISGMARHLDNLPKVPGLPMGFALRKVEEERDAGAFINFALWRWGVPEHFERQLHETLQLFRFGEPGTRSHGWQVFQGERAVAKIGLYVSDSSAGIYAVGTRPEARRKGLARILTLTALQHAKHLRRNIAVLHSTPMAVGLYRSLGFTEVAPMRLYASDDVNL